MSRQQYDRFIEGEKWAMYYIEAQMADLYASGDRFTIARELRRIRKQLAGLTRRLEDKIVRLDLAVAPYPALPRPFVAGWRVESGYEHPPARTAVEVVKYEREVLGNDIGVTPFVLHLLVKYQVPASALTWACDSSDAAERYGDEPVAIGFRNGVAIGADGEDGFLVWSGVPRGARSELESKLLQNRTL